MFGLGMPEILMILAIALIVIGPKKLPELAKTMGRAMGEFKRAAQGMKDAMDIDVSTSSENFPDSGMEDKKNPVDNDLEELLPYDRKTDSNVSDLEEDSLVIKAEKVSSRESIE